MAWPANESLASLPGACGKGRFRIGGRDMSGVGTPLPLEVDLLDASAGPFR